MCGTCQCTLQQSFTSIHCILKECFHVALKKEQQDEHVVVMDSSSSWRVSTFISSQVKQKDTDWMIRVEKAKVSQLDSNNFCRVKQA